MGHLWSLKYLEMTFVSSHYPSMKIQFVLKQILLIVDVASDKSLIFFPPLNLLIIKQIESSACCLSHFTNTTTT